MIELDQLTKTFDGFTAVDHLSFSVEAGEVLGFLGPNGAGKSTSMKMIAGALIPSYGTVKLCGHDIQRETKQAQSMLGYLPEGAPAWSDMTPESFLSFLAQVRSLSGLELEKAKSMALEMADLGHVRFQPIDTLSKGFKRRVGLAAALLHDPKILILDEPTDGLDPNQKHEVRRLISDLSSDKAIIISTHILEEVEAVCSRVIIISNGKMVADDTPVGLLERDPDHQSITFESDLSLEELKKVTAGIEGVNDIFKITDGLFRATANAGQDVYAILQYYVQYRELPLRSLQKKTGRLDHVFRRLTLQKGA